ncbi:MAG: hypothetical protein IJ109_05630 [Firmicutes bacterium]|nr:hypothetical protein [Bacillota bacterium]
MKRRLKRSISVILTVLMVFTAVPAFSWADTGAAAKAGDSAPMTVQAVAPS